LSKALLLGILIKEGGSRARKTVKVFCNSVLRMKRVIPVLIDPGFSRKATVRVISGMMNLYLESFVMKSRMSMSL